jgi:hypothetical protein
MDLKRLISHFTYRIEPKPGGGFIARPNDPTVPALEAATREELQQKIQANIVNALASEFPGLKLPLEANAKYVFHVESKPGGGFALHSADPDTKPIEGASHVDIENHFANKLMEFMGNHLTPELAKTIAASGSSGNVQVFVNMKTGAKVDLNSAELKFGRPETKLVTASVLEFSKPSDAKAGTNFSNLPEPVGNSPITPEAGSGKFFRLLLAVLVIALVLYLFLHNR